MPYSSVSKLPEAVRKHLPRHAQKIYLEAFNHAWQEYAGRKDREETAHKVAWAAVKKRFEKAGDAWKARD